MKKKQVGALKWAIIPFAALCIIGAVSTPAQDSSTPDDAIVDKTVTAQTSFTPELTDSQLPPTAKPTESPSPTPEPNSSPTETAAPEPTPTETPAPTSTPSPTTEPTKTPDTGNTEVSGNTESSGSGNKNNFDTYNNTEQQNTEDTWVLNKSSMKIHYPSCKSVPKIAPKNYATSSESLDNLKSKGYTTCGNCFK